MTIFFKSKGFRKGYTPICGPGYQAGYIWVLYAAKDVYGSWSDDPTHKWVMEQA